MNQNLNIPLAQYKAIHLYRPRIGDFIIHHGWFTHYYGIINGMQENKLHIIKAGLPILLFTMKDKNREQNQMEIYLDDILHSKGGKYTIKQGDIWFV